ncbi:MAG: hypothetical protein R3B09_10645 [Nannocystaceae bacterium]
MLPTALAILGLVAATPASASSRRHAPAPAPEGPIEGPADDPADADAEPTAAPTAASTAAPSTAAEAPPRPVPAPVSGAAGPTSALGDAPARASLAVDTSAIGAQSPVLLRRIEELGDISLRRAEILPGRSTDDPVIAIRIRILDEGGYAIESHLQVGATIVANTERTVLCTLCTEGETVERARTEVERLIPFVRGQAEARARAAEEARAKPPPTEGPVAAPPPGLPTKTKIGAAMTAVGIASLGVGIGLAARPSAPLPEMPLQVRDTKVPGYVLAGVGGALLVGGVGLLLAGRAEHNERRIQLAPAGAGLLLSGRF